MGGRAEVFISATTGELRSYREEVNSNLDPRALEDAARIKVASCFI